MHNLAIALARKGAVVTGSDDEIFEPSRTRLQKQGILPAEIGWFPDKITGDLDGRLRLMSPARRRMEKLV